ncbi:phytanoyl-CoA dioxygenase [Scheffersomyces stipitis CBS 6054]|uniref:Phytanoyl-CoA dioxygenase n=1 Tax=Scheffersomyces stipitis (strain ATCC 58785 / CBS 6054 / NBRC 10063 / NRRL Y-11545) TaxID=322104 RepID=A3LS30_PICST|nr:phytanoyl-CoA dioxygenase [Scheffersomyces stipitis CBS 6054]ABN65838.1 phytanoyl-CoA dioxygenase [Scheffersomyces stipitis CBS 6054]KAG2733504.1 hypothetical protein G9P44_003029 [Scheffersomyces stipitis]
MLGLNEEQVKQYRDEGMICIPDFLTKHEISQLLDRSHELLQDFKIEEHPRTQFKTDDNDHIGDEYFFNSSDKIGFFFDTDAFDKNGNLQYPVQQAINKIGHGLHMKDSLFHKITFDEKVKAIAKSLDYVDPRVLQSMLIFKQPAKADVSNERDNAVPPHTDATFLYTEPLSAIGFWYALEDCTIVNGCLQYLPGSHKVYPVHKRFVKVDGGSKGCNFIDIAKEVPVKESPEDYKIVECKAGSLILIHNSVLHKSEKNHSNKSRFAYAFHVIDGTANYDNLNWLQVPPGPSGGTEFSKLYEE